MVKWCGLSLYSPCVTYAGRLFQVEYDLTPVGMVSAVPFGRKSGQSATKTAQDGTSEIVHDAVHHNVVRSEGPNDGEAYSIRKSGARSNDTQPGVPPLCRRRAFSAPADVRRPLSAGIEQAGATKTTASPLRVDSPSATAEHLCRDPRFLRHRSALLQTCMSAHLHVRTSARLHICTSAHLRIRTSALAPMLLPLKERTRVQVCIAGNLPFVIAS
jgi:hypothetical protein